MTGMYRSVLAIAFLLCLIGIASGQTAPTNSSRPVTAQETSTIQGKWVAVLSAGGSKLRLLLKLKKAADGSYTGSMDSLDQPGANDLVVDTISFNDSVLRFEMKAISGGFEGTLSRDGSEIAGRWRQGALNAILFFRRENAAPPPSQTITQGRMKLVPCNLPNLTQLARCGKYEVFEDRAAARGRKIALNILVLPASGQKPATDPLFFIAGGPGQSAVKVVTDGGDFLGDISHDRDIVFVDQRGTGESNPLNCNLLGDRNDMRGYFADPSTIDVLAKCKVDLEKVANLALYTTPIAMDDLDDVRAALGYDKINLYGGSYGTNAALVYVRQHPDRVRSIVLKGVAPTDFKMPLSFSKGLQNAMDRLIEDCAVDATCHKTFPNLKSEFLEVLVKLEKSPVTVDVLNVVTNEPQQITMGRAAFADHLRLMLYVPDLTSLLPLLIHHAYEGDFAPFAAYGFILTRQIDPQVSRGMQLSVVCAEHIPFITEADITRETAGTYYGDVRIRSFQEACKTWPSVKAPASFVSPVKSSVPVLIISGEVDPVTPAYIAAEAAKGLPNSKQVVIHNGTHLTESPCIMKLITEFISTGNATGLDISCANEIKRPPFIYQLPISFKPAGK